MCLDDEAEDGGRGDRCNAAEDVEVRRVPSRFTTRRLLLTVVDACVSECELAVSLAGLGIPI
jgi:hypothetical protein